MPNTAPLPLPSHATMVERILATYDTATDVERTEGAAWYPAALEIATTIARVHGSDPVTVAAILAAMSPATGWAENVKRATTYVATGTAGHMGNILAKCARIMAGEAPLDVLGGDKVRAFYACILGATDTVCVDRHAVDIVLGRVTDDATRKVLARKGGYATVAAAYVAAGQARGIAPSAMQAATWVAWRRATGAAWYSAGTKDAARVA